jgi:hypothetical protein
VKQGTVATGLCEEGSNDAATPLFMSAEVYAACRNVDCCVAPAAAIDCSILVL